MKTDELLEKLVAEIESQLPANHRDFEWEDFRLEEMRSKLDGYMGGSNVYSEETMTELRQISIRVKIRGNKTSVLT